ncbi:MAG: antibiotic biosynthesis monooxygenase [Halioglobus sp.]|nr:antibiotic biosynthesis monooxygenase [Halioglobus sp.]
MKKVTLKGYVIASDEDLPGITAELPSHIELTRQEDGCLVFEVVQDPNDKHRFYVYEEFIHKEAFEAHQNRAKASSWWAVSRNLEKHYRIKDGF